MSRCTLGFSLAAGLFLCFVIALQTSNFIARTAAQEPQTSKARLQDLLNERVAVTRKLADQTALRVKTANGLPEELLEPTRLALEAALDACGSDKERTKVLEDFLNVAKQNERFALQVVKAGQGRESVALAAAAERLRIEIALARLQAGKAATPKQETKQPVQSVDGVLVFAGSVEAYESVPVFSRVPGTLKSRKVDLGERVKRGQVLAVLDAPEIQTQAEQDAVILIQAHVRVSQTKARVRISVADLEVNKAAADHAEAAAKAAGAMVKFREKQWLRMQDLQIQKAVEDIVVNESKQRLDAAIEADHASKAAIAVAKSQVSAAKSKIEQSEADVAAAEAEVKLAQLKLDASKNRMAATTITAPIDGVVTQCSYSPGELVRTMDKVPITTIQRVDLLRVVTSVPEREVALVKVGNPATVEIAALAGKKWSAKISRTSVVLDPNTRTMRIEIDILNADGQIRPGMFARVSIVKEK